MPDDAKGGVGRTLSTEKNDTRADILATIQETTKQLQNHLNQIQ